MIRNLRAVVAKLEVGMEPDQAMGEVVTPGGITAKMLEIVAEAAKLWVEAHHEGKKKCLGIDPISAPLTLPILFLPKSNVGAEAAVRRLEKITFSFSTTYPVA